MRFLLLLLSALVTALSAQAAESLDAQFQAQTRERQPAVCQGAFMAYEQWVIDHVAHSNPMDRKWQQTALDTAVDATMNMLVLQALVKAGPEAALGPGAASRAGSFVRTRLDAGDVGVKEAAELLDERCKPLMRDALKNGALDDGALQKLYEQAQEQALAHYRQAFELARAARQKELARELEEAEADFLKQREERRR